MNRRQLLQLMLGSIVTTASGNVLASQQSGRRLILIELAGANDGLNTLVPYRDENYHRLRPTIGINGNQIVKLNDTFSIHRSLQALMNTWDNGQMAWVHGLGYPVPNRSHFKSISLWETGSDGRKQHRSGWITHDIEHKFNSDIHGISLVEDMNLFASDHGRWLSMTTPEQFKRVLGSATEHKQPNAIETTVFNDTMASVTQRVTELEQSLFSLSSKLSNTTTVRSIPQSELGAQLRHVVRMIRSGMDTPVYRVRLSGFDTHEYQLNRHSSLLSQLAESLLSFQQTLEADGEWDNTVVMTYSEFGRRASENNSGGTDHGTAAAHMLIGGNINGGFYSDAPALEGLAHGQDPDYTMDYRALYNTVLDHWFGINTNKFSQYHDKRLNQLIS